jgi:hypothetical protein
MTCVAEEISLTFPTITAKDIDNEKKLGYHVDCFYGIEDTTDIARSFSYIDPHLDIDSEDQLRTKLYKRLLL